MNPFATLDDSEREQAYRYSELLACERFYKERANQAYYAGKPNVARIYNARASMFYRARVELVVY